jgi:hypothetical protein
MLTEEGTSAGGIESNRETVSSTGTGGSTLQV